MPRSYWLDCWSAFSCALVVTGILIHALKTGRIRIWRSPTVERLKDPGKYRAMVAIFVLLFVIPTWAVFVYLATPAGAYSDAFRLHAVEKKLAQSNKWHDVSLQLSANGGYTGTAVTSKGELLNVKVDQTASSISASWKNADGMGYGASKFSW